HALVEQGEQVRRPLVVERMAKAWAERVPRELPEDALVIGRAPPALVPVPEHVEKLAVRLGRPRGPLAEDSFELTHEILYLARGDVRPPLAINPRNGLA